MRTREIVYWSLPRLSCRYLRRPQGLAAGSCALRFAWHSDIAPMRTPMLPWRFSTQEFDAKQVSEALTSSRSISQRAARCAGADREVWRVIVRLRTHRHVASCSRHAHFERARTLAAVAPRSYPPLCSHRRAAATVVCARSPRLHPRLQGVLCPVSLRTHAKRVSFSRSFTRACVRHGVSGTARKRKPPRRW